MPFQIIRNDITKVEADAIVNTANPNPVIGRGTDSAIHKAAGPELLEARKRIGALAPGQAAETPAFGLPAKYVIHTVSPSWIDGTHREEELLRKAYDSALALAEQLGCRSVAFPLMAAGSYGFPRDLALSVAIAAFTDFLMDHDMTVELVLFNGKAFNLAFSLFSDLKSYIDDNYVEEKRKEEYGSSLANRRRRESMALPETDLFRDADITFNEGFTAPMAPVSGAKPSASLADILRQSESTFSEYLLDLLKERSGKDSEVYKRAEISKQLFSKILSNKYYQPTKSTAIQLAIGLQLDLIQTQKLLEKAGFALTRSSKADLVVQYYIERKVYSVTFINEALSDCGLPLLKTGLKA